MDALALWQQKKDFLEAELAIATDAAQKFALQRQIEECNANIQRLSQLSASNDNSGNDNSGNDNTIGLPISLNNTRSILQEPDKSDKVANKIKVFVSYSHKDNDLREELMVHLSSLKRQDKIETWYDGDIEGGQEFGNEITNQLNTADIILLLISPRFIASDYCYSVEMEGAMNRHGQGEARVIPIILKPVDWHNTPFSKLNALPKEGKPVTTWANPDEAFLDIAKGIRRVVDTLQT